MGRRKTVLRSKLIKTERYKILSESYKEPGLKQYANRWKKTNKLIFLKDGAGNCLSVVVRTYVTQEKYPRSWQKVQVACLCCMDLLEPFEFFTPSRPYKRKHLDKEYVDNHLELGGKAGSTQAWQLILGPILEGKELKL